MDKKANGGATMNGDDWLEAELADTLDENFELELSEPALPDRKFDPHYERKTLPPELHVPAKY